MRYSQNTVRALLVVVVSLFAFALRVHEQHALAGTERLSTRAVVASSPR